MSPGNLEPGNMSPTLYDEVFGNHNRYNIAKNDGCICFFCKKEIPLVIKDKRIKRTYLHTLGTTEEREITDYDRSNRVDFDIVISRDKKRTKTLSAHLSCWENLVYDV